MKKISYIFCAVFVLAFWACDQEQTKVSNVSNTSEAKMVTQKVNTKYANGTKGRTPAGYEYIHHISNNTNKPQEGDQVKYHKLVYKNDTSLLQSTYLLLEPRADIMIPRDSAPSPPHPTYDALFLMSPGDSLTVYQDLDTFPVNKLPEGITPEDRFSYTMNLLSIKEKAQIEKEIKDTKARHITVTDSLRTFVKDFKAGKLKNKMIKTETGLQYFVHKEGTGKKVKDGGFVKVHYLGILEDGTIFDGSFIKAKPFPTRIGRKRVIDGWDEGIPLMNEGGEATFVVPWQLAYGVSGRPPAIPQRADLYFYISLVSVY